MLPGKGPSSFRLAGFSSLFALISLLQGLEEVQVQVHSNSQVYTILEKGSW
jgi:hypothetical protein